MSNGTLEASISKALVQWEKDYMGRGPIEVKTDIVRDMIVISLKGVLSIAEEHLAQDNEGMALVMKVRQLLVEQGRAELEELLMSLTSAKVISLYTDISAKTGERIFIFRMNRILD